MPIFNLEKPVFITNQLLKAILEAYEGNTVIGWGLILGDVVPKAVNKVSNKNSCPLTPFLYHLHAQYGWLILGGMKALRLHLERRRDLFFKESTPAVGVSVAAQILLGAPRAGESSSYTGRTSTRSESSSPCSKSLYIGKSSRPKTRSKNTRGKDRNLKTGRSSISTRRREFSPALPDNEPRNTRGEERQLL